MKSKVIGFSDSKRLQELAENIRNNSKSADELTNAAVARLNAAGAEAILVGSALSEVKKILGDIAVSDWLVKHCKGVSEAKARSFMKLAARDNMDDLARIYAALGLKLNKNN